MIKLTVNGVSATVTEKEVLTAGRVGLECEFSFTDEWDGLFKTAVFQGIETVDVALVGSTCVVPHESMAVEGVQLKIGVYGANGAGTIVIPTIWANAGKIQPSAIPSGTEPAAPTQNANAYAVETSEQALAIAQSVRTDADNGVFDGATGPQGETGPSGVYIGDNAPTDPDVNVWIDTDGDPDSEIYTSAEKTKLALLSASAQIPQGGTTGQVLAKASGTDYDAEWVDQSGGTSDYTDLANKPSINGIVLSGNKTAEDLHLIQDPGAGDAGDVLTMQDVDGELSWVSASIPKEIYWAEYGTTPAAAIRNAGRAGYLVLCEFTDNDGNRVYLRHQESDDSGVCYLYGRMDATGEEIVAEVSGSTWTITRSNIMPSASEIGAYEKPSGGIPATDLASAVQTSLGLADTALQPTSGNAYRSASIPFAACDSASTNTAFTATVDGITELRDGVCVWLKNGVIASASGCTLNINNLGAKPIYKSIAAATAITTEFGVNYTMLFIYNSTRVTGGCWDMVYGYDTNTTYTPVKLGFGYTTCSTAEATLAKTAALSSYVLTAGGIVTVKFTNAVPAGATLNVNSKGAKAIYYRGAAITDDVIKAGDTATFIYSTYYHLISIDRNEAPVTSVNGQTGAVSLSIPSSAADVGAIAAPATPSDGQFLVYSSAQSAWVAQTVPSANGVNF